MILAALSAGQLLRWVAGILVLGSILVLVVIPALRQGVREGRAEVRQQRAQAATRRRQEWGQIIRPDQARPRPSDDDSDHDDDVSGGGGGLRS